MATICPRLPAAWSRAVDEVSPELGRVRGWLDDLSQASRLVRQARMILGALPDSDARDAAAHRLRHAARLLDGDPTDPPTVRPDPTAWLSEDMGVPWAARIAAAPRDYHPEEITSAIRWLIHRLQHVHLDLDEARRTPRSER